MSADPVPQCSREPKATEGLRGSLASSFLFPRKLGSRLRGNTNGFTLIEMLVALAIFSLAALALLRLQGGTLSSTARLQSSIVAGIVARNVVVEALTDPIAPTLGRVSGREINAGRAWTWTRLVARTGEAPLQQITVTVADETGRQAATLTAFRGVT